MIQLCRHILPSGLLCNQASVRDTLFCRHHDSMKQTVAACQPTPNLYGVHTPLPFAYPEDRAALQTNYFLVLQALNDKRIDNRTANTMNRLLRSCEMNLARGPLVEAANNDVVQRVVLTPQGDEIAPPRERLEDHETSLAHGHDCPCRKCAEQHRGAAPEQHHAHCKCGLCGTESQGGETQSTETKGAETQSTETQSTEADAVKGAEMDGAEAKSAETQAVKSAETQAAETQAEKTQAAQGAETQRAEMKNAVRIADAQKLYAREPEKLYDESASDESPYKRIIREYEARQAAIEAGLIERPAPKPIDPNGPYAQGKRKDEEINAQIERNKQAGHELWLKRFAHLQQNYQPMHPQQQPSLNNNQPSTNND